MLQSTDSGGMDKKARLFYMLSTQDLKTLTDWKWEDRKTFTTQMKKKKKSSCSNAFIRQNGL